MPRLRRWGTSLVATVATLSLAATALAATGWTVETTPTTSTNAVIYGAAARTNSDAWAVGTAFGTAGSTPPPPISYHLNGAAWSLVPTANLNGSLAGLVGVSASTSTDAWAVGFTRSGGYRGQNSLFEHWNGTAWSVVAGVNLGGMAGVADLSPSNAWAATTKGLVEHWDGTAWTAVTTPQPNPSNTFGNRVTSVSASGPSDVWMVGTYTTPSYTDEAYSLHYDGSAWHIVQMAQPATGTPRISAVTALSTTDAWAAGQTGADALVEHWNGTSWTLMPTPSGVQYPTLNAVAARAANDLWAFGTQYTGTQSNTLLLHWDGSGWSTAPTPVPALLYAAAANPGGSRVWAMGVGSTNRPLILSHS